LAGERADHGGRPALPALPATAVGRARGDVGGRGNLAMGVSSV